MRFIQALGDQTPLREALRRAGRAAELDQIAALARSAGFEFSVAELQDAFARDWSMRRAFYASLDPEGVDAAADDGVDAADDGGGSASST